MQMCIYAWKDCDAEVYKMAWKLWFSWLIGTSLWSGWKACIQLSLSYLILALSIKSRHRLDYYLKDNEELIGQFPQQSFNDSRSHSSCQPYCTLLWVWVSWLWSQGTNMHQASKWNHLRTFTSVQTPSIWFRSTIKTYKKEVTQLRKTLFDHAEKSSAIFVALSGISDLKLILRQSTTLLVFQSTSI